MAYLLDTNVLLRSIQPHHAQHREAVNAVAKLLEEGERVYVVPQVIIEFWNVCTRPADKNGLGLTPQGTEGEVRKIEALVKVLPETASIFDEWRKLVILHQVSGVEVHDARIVAAMKVHDITHVLTFNQEDFRRYAGVVVVLPGSVE